MKKITMRMAILQFCVAVATVFAGFAVAAGDLAAPTGKVILTVNGAIQHTNGDGAAQFDLEMLRALPTETLVTTSVWFEDSHSFTGVPLRDLLAAVGATGMQVDAIAINDYKVAIPAPGANDLFPIVAYFMDDAEMPVREKGPLWVIYPYDLSAEYRNETTYSRSIWQLKTLTVKN
jgi:hypothetical protein